MQTLEENKSIQFPLEMVMALLRLTSIKFPITDPITTVTNGISNFLKIQPSKPRIVNIIKSNVDPVNPYTPTNETTIIIGIKNFGGSNNTFAKILTIGIFKINKIMFPINNEAIKPQTTSGFFSNSSGPGVIFIVNNIARRTAVVPDPGTPRANIGTNAPPAAALFPDSGAVTPRSSPSPKVLFLFDIFFQMCTQ